MISSIYEFFFFTATLNFSEKLLLSLNFVDHLTVDVFDVEVFSGDNKGSLIISEVVQSVVDVCWLVLSQTVVSYICLLKTVNRIRLLVHVEGAPDSRLVY